MRNTEQIQSAAAATHCCLDTNFRSWYYLTLKLCKYQKHENSPTSVAQKPAWNSGPQRPYLGGILLVRQVVICHRPKFTFQLIPHPDYSEKCLPPSTASNFYFISLLVSEEAADSSLLFHGAHEVKTNLLSSSLRSSPLNKQLSFFL